MHAWARAFGASAAKATVGASHRATRDPKTALVPRRSIARRLTSSWLMGFSGLQGV
jgi:hypothetical protein